MENPDMKKKKQDPDSFLSNLTNKLKLKKQDQEDQNMLDEVVSSNNDEVHSPMSDDHL